MEYWGIFNPEGEFPVAMESEYETAKIAAECHSYWHPTEDRYVRFQVRKVDVTFNTGV